MSSAGSHFHYVCTHAEAWELIEERSQFWVSNCGCRENKGKCERSRMDLCLQFAPNTEASGSGKRTLSKAEVAGILYEASEKHLVARPFHGLKDYTVTEGICFCCDDCCEYFTKPEENHCDKGQFIEQTDFKVCNHCGDCVSVCRFGARMMNGQLSVDREKCYGCGLCAELCPLECIEMAAR
ncbi:MAG: 4Fe-4S binding protein [bacterium]|nr:4Fe-4S binding protein [bacterium]